jgi:hypothetical protein
MVKLKRDRDCFSFGESRDFDVTRENSLSMLISSDENWKTDLRCIFPVSVRYRKLYARRLSRFETLPSYYITRRDLIYIIIL